jgi:tetratricopeptide (TPR) repeat protein
MSAAWLIFALLIFPPEMALSQSAPVDLGIASDAGNFDALWDFTNPRESEKAFRALMLDVTGKHDQQWVVQLQTQIARALVMQKKFSEAKKLLDAIEGPAQKNALSGVRFALEKGRYLLALKNESKAKSFFTLAYEMAEDRSLDYFSIDAARMLGGLAKNPAGLIEWNKKALAIAAISKGPAARRWLGVIHHDMGWAYFDMEKYNDALHSFRGACEAALEQKDEEGERIARWATAKMLRLVARPHEALREQQKLETEYERLKRPDGYVFEEMSELLLVLNKENLSQEYARKAYDLLAPGTPIAREKERMARLQKLAGIIPEAPKPTKKKSK